MRPLYRDESIWIPVADGLRRRRWAVLIARDKERVCNSDWEHLPYEVDNDWILMTFDDDFLSLVEGSDFEHAGIVYIQQAGREIGTAVKAVDAHLETRSVDDRSIHYC